MKRRLNTIGHKNGPHYRAWCIDGDITIIIRDCETIEEAQTANREYKELHPNADTHLEPLT